MSLTNIRAADIDYMNKYRDFENDPVNFGYEEGGQFLKHLRENHQHYVPIVDSAIYAPNPEDPDDAYPPYDRGIAANAFMLNPDGSVYIGAVWPGYTGMSSPYEFQACNNQVLTLTFQPV
jgi:alpha-glucosidase